MSNITGDGGSFSSGNTGEVQQQQQQQLQHRFHGSNSGPSTTTNSNGSTSHQQQQQQSVKKKRNLPGNPDFLSSGFNGLHVIPDVDVTDLILPQKHQEEKLCRFGMRVLEVLKLTLAFEMGNY